MAVPGLAIPVPRQHLIDCCGSGIRGRLVRTIALPGAPIIGPSLYPMGRLAHWDEVADLGLHGTEAILIHNLVVTAIKWTVGRARPYAVADGNPNDYQFFRGFR